MTHLHVLIGSGTKAARDAAGAARAVGAASQAKSNQEEGLMKIFSKTFAFS